ncbi:hypothetical protein EST38_g3654 [Candolleomyces aberdarensis]|uniref:Uncharacterized protein n=1 Tax=Candolleomyces aberdarensis TaxID=2316362 RepID=A0A4Q2DT06_9AGAR|nr:hypothetical protein EST38_g3654 [Candolleomyces aberdarensis]
MKEAKPNHVPELLKHIISGNSPHVHWAEELQIRDMLPTAADGWLEYNPWLGEERQMMLASQKQDLVSAIRSLIRVERVQFEVSLGESYMDPLCAIAELPRLRDLELAFWHSFDFDNAQIPLARFSELRRVKLRNLAPTPAIVKGLERLIANSPSMSQLTIICLPVDPDDEGDNVRQHWLDLSSVFEAALAPVNTPSLSEQTVQNTAPPSLSIENLTVAGMQILSPTAVPYLRSLTSLSIFNNSVQIDPLFWNALKTSKVHLQKLTVYLILQPIIDYLLSYDGLEDIMISTAAAYAQFYLMAGQNGHGLLPSHIFKVF